MANKEMLCYALQKKMGLVKSIHLVVGVKEDFLLVYLNL
jgi:hypothetical protein